MVLEFVDENLPGSAVVGVAEEDVAAAVVEDNKLGGFKDGL